MSQVQQAGGGTANRQRVVIGGDASGAALVDPVAVDPGKNPMALPVLPVAVVADTQESGFIDGELRRLSLTPSGRLRVSSEVAPTDMDCFGDDARAMGMTDPDNFTFTPDGDPFGF